MKSVARGPVVGEPVAIEGGGLAWADPLEGGRAGVEALHPYLGFALDPERNEVDVGGLGFVARAGRDGLPVRREGAVVVGVFGGSFANGIASQAGATLARCPAFDGQSVEIHSFAPGGYKQPQPLLTLAWLLGLGAELDLVLEVDGHNEVALPLVENVPHGVHPHYPRLWHLRTAAVLGPERARTLGRLELVRDARDRWAQLFLSTRLYRSPALALVWQLRDASLSRRGRALEDAIAERRPVARGPADAEGPAELGRPAALGPRWAGEGASREQALGLLADHWMRSSLGMRALADASGARYVHALQPSQYLAGSKPMSARERAVALGRGPTAEAAELGFPMLVERLARLRARGVDTVDLTSVFAEEVAPRYVDDCCHVDARGYEMAAEAICRALEASR
jgi:hypothetical protein